jgi:predicted secreted protein
MGTSDWTSRMLPRDLNGIIMWTTSFMMLFLLIRRFDTAKRLKVGFWAKDAFTETFIHLFIWSLTIAAFIYYVFFGGKIVLVSTAEQLPPMPSTFYSIILSVIAFGTFLVTILRYTARSERKYPAPRNFLISFAILAVFLGMRYAILFLAPPWGDPIHSIVNVVIDTCVFGLLFPYIFAGAILYMISALRAT